MIATAATTIPSELRDMGQWVSWRYEVRDGKRTKVPIDPHSGTRASTTDPSTWASFDEATAAAEDYGLAGVGFVFTGDDPYVGIDLDKCVDPVTEAVEPWAQAIVDYLDGYTELSPSRTGIHIIVKGQLPAGRKRLQHVEMYGEARFFCVTGRALT